MKLLFSTILYVPFLVATCNAQLTGNSAINHNEWGKSVNGIRMSIAVSNSVISVDAELAVSVKMENLSTNIVYIQEFSPESDFEFVLKDNSGKAFQLTQSVWVGMGDNYSPLEPNEIHDWILHLPVDRYYEPTSMTVDGHFDFHTQPIKKHFPPGDYTLEATHPMRLSKSETQLEVDSVASNLLKVQIK